MKKSLILLCAALTGFAPAAFGWGKTGHDAVAYIAECNVKGRTKRIVERYLGRSMVYDASWMDAYRHTPAYRHTSPWHTADVDAALRYAPRNGGDAVAALEAAVERLRNRRNLSDSAVAVNLRMVIHLVGDLHCPGHVDYAGRARAGQVVIVLAGRKHNYHTFWDSYILESTHKWHYTEWRQQLDRCTRRQRRALGAGTPRAWFEQSARDCRVIYELPEGGRFGGNEGRDFVNEMKVLGEEQILKAGYRLAALLDDIL